MDERLLLNIVLFFIFQRNVDIVFLCRLLSSSCDRWPQNTRPFLLLLRRFTPSSLHLSEIIMSFSSLLFSLKSYCLELEQRLSCASLYSVQWTRNSFFRFLLSLITKSLGLPVGLVSQFLFPVCDH